MRLGNENYRWKGKDELKARGCTFSKDKVIWHVEATSPQIARMFASYTAAAIAAV